jgi:glycosyltransferase involved in cell wall biosynthesis
MKVTILIPVYNEEKTIDLILRKVLNQKGPWEKEVIVINDGSTDGTIEKLQKFLPEITLVNLSKNQGKGIALKKGLEKATGDITLIQDADLEYDPNDYPELLKPILDNKTKVVFGSRNLGQRKYLYKRYLLGGIFLTKLVNLIFQTKLTDINTGYKVFKTDTLKEIGIRSEGFEVCEELTIKALKRKLKIIEVPIFYNPREFKEGKKIKWLDGLKAVWAIFYFFIFG